MYRTTPMQYPEQLTADATDLIHTVCERVNEDYAWAQYGDFKVLMRTKDRYINAAHLCKQATADGSPPKRFPYWLENGTTPGILKAAAIQEQLPQDVLISRPSNLPSHLRGTFVHPCLAPTILLWADPTMSLKVGRVYNAHVVDEVISKPRSNMGSLDAVEHLPIRQQHRPHAMAGYVYFIVTDRHHEDHAVKIGHTCNLDTRLRVLQCGSMAVLTVYKSVYTTDRCKLEREVHRLCARHRVRGEWFRLTLAQVDELVTNIEGASILEAIEEQQTPPYATGTPESILSLLEQVDRDTYVWRAD